MTNSLKHIGVLGMKWGKRGGQSGPSGDKSSGVSTGIFTGKPKGVQQPPHPDHQVAHSLKGKRLSSMSNAEIMTLTKRMNLEKQYRDAKKQDHSNAKKFLHTALANAGQQVAATYIAKAMNKGVQTMIEIFKITKS
jgi:hypothetical protein